MCQLNKLSWSYDLTAPVGSPIKTGNSGDSNQPSGSINARLFDPFMIYTGSFISET